MSGKNNVNPDHYKVAGRDRPNEALAAEPRVPAEHAYLAPAKGRRAPNFIPGALPVGEAHPPAATEAVRRGALPARRTGKVSARTTNGASRTEGEHADSGQAGRKSMRTRPARKRTKRTTAETRKRSATTRKRSTSARKRSATAHAQRSTKRARTRR
jgi:hypothetical protein